MKIAGVVPVKGNSERIENKNIPLFLYCFSGARSEEACMILKRKGYSHIKNIGGIQFYQETVSK